MGRNKALMQLAGKTLIARVLDRLARLCDELIISADIAEASGLAGADLLTWYRAGVFWWRSRWIAGHAQRRVVTACDMPFLT
jgi:molybdopterin-guanine dinucleotide biosynthesis protein A